VGFINFHHHKCPLTIIHMRPIHDFGYSTVAMETCDMQSYLEGPGVQ